MVGPGNRPNLHELVIVHAQIFRMCIYQTRHRPVTRPFADAADVIGTAHGTLGRTVIASRP